MNKYETYSLLALRILLGGLFIYSGTDKLLNDFTAAGYLEFATEGPLKDVFVSLAGNPLVDNLVVGGERLIGLALILGVLIKLTSFAGILMMILFYVSVIPQEHGPISEHIIYIAAFLVIAAFGSRIPLSLDLTLKDKLPKNNLLNKFLG